MNLFQVLESGLCGPLNDVIGIIKFIMKLIQFIVPLVLIVLCTIDLFKAMTSGDEKNIEKAKKGAITRLVYAIVIFLIPFVVNLAFSLIGNLTVDNNNSESVRADFFDCWSKWEEFSENNDDTSKNNDDTSKKKCYINGEVASKYTTQAACESITGAVWGE